MNNQTHFLPCIPFVFLTYVLSCTSVNSQIIPDNTLGTNELSVVKTNIDSNGLSIEQIDGGAVRGTNLFHSFKEFNINEGQGAYFINPTGIESIISRVTGGNPSNILGALGVRGGNANLFLINPNGIIFGANARLDLNGSFLASSASSVHFPDGIQFSATNPQPVPLLKINVPIGLEFASEHPGAISVEGTGHNLFFSGVVGTPILGSGQSLNGLRTSSGKTIALIGGDVNFDGGILTAPSGRIELGSANSGFVSVDSTPTGLFFGYNGVQKFRSIQLNNRALLDTSGFFNGDISLYAGKISLTNDSIILISNFGSLPSGQLNIIASDALELEVNGLPLTPGQMLLRGISTQSFSSGKGADINIFSHKLDVQNSAQLVTHTFGSGAGGNINITLEDWRQSFDNSPSETSLINGGIATLTSGTEKAGDLTLSAEKLSLELGSTFASETFGFGNAGKVEVNTSDSIEVSGGIQLTPNSFLPSFLGSLTASSGDAGEVKINTRELILKQGGNLSSSTFALGSANNILISATDSITISDRVSGSLNTTQINSSANVADPIFIPIFNLPNTLSGESRFVSIKTNELNIRNGGQVSVSNDGIRGAGTLKIEAKSVNLDNQGSITAATASGQGGEIRLTSQNLQLRNNSKINATARGNSIGGNIIIDTNTLVALEDSDISANSNNFRGGTVTINAQGIFGTEFRDKLSPESDITATGENSGLNGVVEINTPDIDFTRATAQPVAELESPEVASVCYGRAGTATSELINAGTGGIPVSPSDPLNSNAGWEDNSLPTQFLNSKETARAANTEINKPEQLIEAQGWKWNADGTLSMTLEPEEIVPYSSLTTSSCHQVNHPQSVAEYK